MKTYCRGLVVDEATVMRALEEWEGTRAGRKNAWRVPREHGSREALVREVLDEVRGRRLKFRPTRCEERLEGGKMRRIGVESVKQQVAGQVLIMCARPLFEARVGRYQCAGVAGRGQTYAARAVRRWLDRGDCRYWSKSDLHKCYQSVRHDVVRGWFARHMGSADLRYIVDALLDTPRSSLRRSCCRTPTTSWRGWAGAGAGSGCRTHATKCGTSTTWCSWAHQRPGSRVPCARSNASCATAWGLR